MQLRVYSHSSYQDRKPCDVAGQKDVIRLSSPPFRSEKVDEIDEDEAGETPVMCGYDDLFLELAVHDPFVN